MVIIDINRQGIDTCPVWQQGDAAAYTSNTFLCSRKDASREESSVNMKIFTVLRDLHAELPGLTMLFFFSYLDDKVWNISKHDSLVWLHQTSPTSQVLIIGL